MSTLVLAAALGCLVGVGYLLLRPEDEARDPEEDVTAGAAARTAAGCPLTDPELRALLQRYVRQGPDALSDAELDAVARCSTGAREEDGEGWFSSLLADAREALSDVDTKEALETAAAIGTTIGIAAAAREAPPTTTSPMSGKRRTIR